MNVPRVYRFHQFVYVETGATHSALFHFLTGHIYHVSNQDLVKMEAGQYADIQEFLEFCKAEELIIAIDPRRWIPRISFSADKKKVEDTLFDTIWTLEIQQGADLSLITKRFEQTPVQKIFYYGSSLPASPLPRVPIMLKEEDPAACRILATVDHHFTKTNEKDYLQNMVFHTCWGGKIAITMDNQVRPCIYSSIILGNLQEETVAHILNVAQPYWRLTRDKITTCQECEFKFTCFDCRESAFQQSADLYAHNPGCSYNPRVGPG